ncbi:NUDIX domain-containing protein [Cytobacillus firmus]|uniref:NUDIX domain-containing protein n=1 Tax=Cytobacillus firmus TaxID=1399 RepID=UPI001F5130F4|nr:NUDIX domain-containing protein [Cytobacillus firmus]MED1941123.1 NUDIX domain-containing protein [Cytobacillus firmus]
MGYVMDLRKIVGSRPLVITGASVIILDENNRLLLQLRKDNNCWGLAGGSLEPGETLEDVAKREMLEETGLTANDSPDERRKRKRIIVKTGAYSFMVSFFLLVAFMKRIESTTEVDGMTSSVITP